eukprot:768749-Hanusia_phi.AAC.20
MRELPRVVCLSSRHRHCAVMEDLREGEKGGRERQGETGGDRGGWGNRKNDKTGRRGRMEKGLC